MTDALQWVRDRKFMVRINLGEKLILTLDVKPEIPVGEWTEDLKIWVDDGRDRKNKSQIIK